MKAHLLPGVWGEGSGEMEGSQGQNGGVWVQSPWSCRVVLRERGRGGGDLSLKAKGDPEKLGSHPWGREDVGSLGPHRELSGG